MHAGSLAGRAFVAEVAPARGHSAIQFNAVVETNTAAVRLWQDLGFEVLTTVPAAFESRTHGRVGLHLMVLEL
jgi:hypothetical protein